jgi:hypothetical protein
MPPRTQTSVGMETVDQTVARAQKLVPRNNQTATPKVDVSGSTVISPDSLAAPSPLKITPPPVDTATAGMQGVLETAQGTTDTFLRDLSKQRETTETTKNTSLQAYLDSLMAPGEVAQTAAQYATEGGVDAIQQELDTVNNQILQEQNALRRKIERIQSSGGGLASGAEAETYNLERESLAKQADLYVIQMGVQGRFDSAKTIADRAVAAQLESAKQRQDILGLLYQDNKEQFTKAEQREFETKQADRNRVIEEEASNKKSIYELAIQAQMDGAPTAVVQQMMSAKSKEEALGIGGQYIGALDREQKRASIAANYASIDLAERKFQYEQQKDALTAELEAMEAAGTITKEQAAQQTKVEQALTLKDLVSQIRGHAGFNLSVGSIGERLVGLEGGIAGQLYNYLSGQGEGFDALYDQLTENLTLANLDKMTGVLTDRDIQVLRSAATRLRKTTTETEFLGVLDEMERTFDRAVQENGLTPQQARFYYGVDDEALSEIDALWGESTPSSTIDFTY